MKVKEFVNLCICESQYFDIWNALNGDVSKRKQLDFDRNKQSTIKLYGDRELLGVDAIGDFQLQLIVEYRKEDE